MYVNFFVIQQVNEMHLKQTADGSVSESEVENGDPAKYVLFKIPIFGRISAVSSDSQQFFFKFRTCIFIFLCM